MLAQHLGNHILDAEQSLVDSIIPLNPVACPLRNVVQCSIVQSDDGAMLLCLGLSFQSQLSLAILDLVPWQRLTTSGHHGDVQHLATSVAPHWALVQLPIPADADMLNEYSLIVSHAEHRAFVLHNTAACASVCLESGNLAAVGSSLSRSTFLGVQRRSFVVLENLVLTQLTPEQSTAAKSEVDQINTASASIAGSIVSARATSSTHENATQLESSANSVLIFGIDEDDKEASLEEAVEGQLHFMCHAEHFLFIRSAPNTVTGNKIAQLHYKDQVEVTGRLGLWLRLSWPSEDGASTAWALAVATDQYGLRHLMLCPVQRVPRSTSHLITSDMAILDLADSQSDRHSEGGTTVELTLPHRVRVARLKLAFELDERLLLNVTTLQLLVGKEAQALEVDLRACQIVQVTRQAARLTDDVSHCLPCRWMCRHWL